MGWYNGKDGSYYQQHVEVKGCSNKITEGQKVFNKLSLNEIREGIEVAQQQFMRDMKDISNVQLKVPYSKTKEEPIEYVVKEVENETTGEER